MHLTGIRRQVTAAPVRTHLIEMTSLQPSDLIVPVGVGLLGLWVIMRLNQGEQKSPQRRFEMDRMAAGVNGELSKWQDTSTHGHHVPLHHESEALDVNDRLEYIKTDYKGDIVRPEDRGHAFSQGWHPGMTRTNGQLVTLRMVNDHKKSVAQTRPGYPRRKPRSEAISN